MLSATLTIAPPRAAAHHEDADRRLPVDIIVEPFDPTIEPSPAQFEEIFCEIPVDRSGGAELDLAGMAQRARLLVTTRFIVPVLPTAGFDRLVLALSTICRCPNRSKHRSWPRDRRESGECRLSYCYDRPSRGGSLLSWWVLH